MDCGGFVGNIRMVKCGICIVFARIGVGCGVDGRADRHLVYIMACGACGKSL